MAFHEVVSLIEGLQVEKNLNRMSQFQNAHFYPISASCSNFNPRNIQYIPVVKIFAFLDLEQN
jgi:hypothetical protein